MLPSCSVKALSSSSEEDTIILCSESGAGGFKAQQAHVLYLVSAGIWGIECDSVAVGT